MSGWRCRTDMLWLPLQDFLREADVRFMNHLRRGTSIVEGDLQQDPPPATLQVCRPAAHKGCNEKG